MLRRSSPTPPPLQKPHHHPKRSPFNPFYGSFSPILRSPLESFLEPLYMGGFKAGGCRKVAMEKATTRKMKRIIMFK
ncbi:hypothetical protein NC653_026111 [Populus alba x Populus x berolinensis]|uniref:Uncharacterized protein n=1 Tax=Populus alba x Populus x berolinensis TaxID=444605 RepID=A0AAD6QAS1_9ROSI|nr:hypothetical protein NC653_026111 [Populus alba x Populus x berolinensis]